MKRDQLNHLHPVSAIAPQVVTNASVITSATIDIDGYNALTFIVLLGTLAATAVTGTVEVFHGDASDMSDEAAVPDAELVGTETLAGFTQADDGECRKIGYLGIKRYVRIKVTPTSNDANLPISALAMLGHPAVGPTDNPPQ